MPTLDQEEIANQLNAERQSARVNSQTPGTFSPANQVGSALSIDNQLNRGNQTVDSAGQAGFSQDMSEGDMQQQLAGAKNAARQAEAQGGGSRYDQVKAGIGKAREIAALLSATKHNTLSLSRYAAASVVVLIQDGMPLVLDLLLGIGWVFGYIWLPATLFLLYIIIFRKLPRSYSIDILKRMLFYGGIELIPYVGEALPMWCAFLVNVFIYERRRAAKEVMQASATVRNQSLLDKADQRQSQKTAAAQGTAAG